MLSGHLCVWNGADYLDACIEHAIPHLDELVIIEGKWQKVGKASTDGTIQILQKWASHPKVKILFNRDIHGQNPSRDAYFQITEAKPGDWMIILDFDEFYKDDMWEEIKRISREEKIVEGYSFRNIVFVNRYDNFLSHGYFPRMVKLEKYNKLNINHVYHSQGLKADEYLRSKAYKYKRHKTIATFHYSYMITRERFEQKVEQRIVLEHRPFAWQYKKGKIVPKAGDHHVAAGVKPFRGKHPQIIEDRFINNNKNKEEKK